MSDTNKYRDAADKDVESVEVGDSPSEVESKVLGLGHVSGLPDEAEKDNEAADTEG